jgi:NTE family protein
MTRVGLVLGAGGVVGQAYHSGVLAVLEHDLGFDARRVDMVVGTSAGSITGTLLRLGVSAGDLAAWTVKAPLSGDDVVLRRMAGTPVPELAPFNPLHLLRPLRLPGRHMLQRAVVRPWQFRPLAAGMALVAPGRHDVVEQLGALRELEGPEWPTPDLWVCAVRRRDGRRVVFGRPGTPAAPLHRAVAASCAVPGYFAPVRIGGHSYVDGGVHSPTNADVLVRAELDLVVVLSPMSAAHGRALSADAAMRWSAHVRLEREVRRLRAAGTEVVRIEPGRRALAAMGINAMADDRAERVVQAAFLDTGHHVSRGSAAERLAALATRPSRRRPAA